MPTALPTPWPSGPVVVSTPGVWLTSGWPGVREPQVRSASQVVELQAVAGEVELDVEGQARVAHRQHEPVAAGPVRVARVVPQPLLEQQVGRRAPCSSRCRGGRCRPSGRRPWPARARCRWPGGRARRSPRAGSGAAGRGCRWGRRSRPRPGPRTRCSACRVMWCGAPSGRPASARCAGRPGRGATGRAGPGRSRRRRRRRPPYPLHAQHQRDQTLVVALAPRRGGPAAGLQWRRSRPRFEEDLRALLPARRRAPRAPGDGALRAPRRPPARSGRSARRCGAYVALTKPRIIELLLVTTLPAMMLAARGWPSWRLLWPRWSAARSRPGRPTSSTATYDRDIDQLMHRTQRRPLPIGRDHARAAALVFGVVLTVASLVLLAAYDDAAGRGARGGRDLLLRRPLHDGAQAAHPAQHPVRRGARARRRC